MLFATVEDSTAGLGQILRTGRPLVGYPSMASRGCATSSLPQRLPGGLQASGHEKAADAGLGLLLWTSDSCL